MQNAAAFRTMLFVQWKLQRTELLALTLVAAAIAPVATWPIVRSGVDPMIPLIRMVDGGSLIKSASGLLALGIGALLAIRPFALDARARHTYSLALPIPRSRYAFMRVGTGLSLGLIPVLGFLIGALVAVQIVPDTVWVQRYPLGLALRFLLAVVVAFAMFFGIQYGLGNRALRWVVIVALTVGGVEVIGQALAGTSMIGPTLDLLSGSYSPVRIFRDRWALFDV